MIEDELSKLPASSLADYRGDPRLDRVWRRVESDLGEPRPRPRLGLLALPAAGVGLFALGVLVGRAGDGAGPAPLAVAEPVPVSQPASRPRPPAAERRLDPARPGDGPAASPRRADQPRLHSAPAAAVSANEPPIVAAPAPILSAEPPGPPEWQRLAELGDLVTARAALERQGGFDTAFDGASAEALMMLVDIARATGSREQAVSALRRLLDGHAGAPEAPLAAWTLGNLLEQSGDRAGAAEAFALYRRLSPTGDFAEDAAARQVESALDEGDLERARQLVDQYAKDFPLGRRVAELRDALAKAESDAALGAGDEPAAPELDAPQGPSATEP